MTRLKHILLLLFPLYMCSCNTEQKTTTPKEIRTSKTDEPIVVSPLQHARIDENIEEKLFELLTKWRKAQNKGDFEQYSSFYSESFRGVKRVADKTTKYDHTDWLANRKKCSGSL